MTVYHGSTEIIKNPDVLHSYRPLDFGKGFYVTSNKEQAKVWAKRKGVILESKKSIVNIFEMNENFSFLQCKNFGEDLSEWIDFVCHCRDGGRDYEKYDLIFGKVANDKVFRVVDMYHNGLWDKERAIKEIKAYPDYGQIAFITQKAINQVLKFISYEEV
ncbi:MAG: DUF3990 domain-containing protein [Treponema sp.]|nr:DUF3990 domain-containing protein [Treponema sp.]MBP5576795.1 DUF3990 domain-containing protein [Treponema sp.]MBQ1670717.1 DUF3990 domain-containing protein [Treponema sp.]MBQ2356260.1 DUF3990 domain-containing protein [Treponema sp.]MBQ2571726.1 DUF3990 domain-containing protein [Treponema sp.]